MKDNRLFKGELLYCEGKHKPFLRGKIHLASLVFFPMGFYYLHYAKHPITGNRNLITNIVCYATIGPPPQKLLCKKWIILAFLYGQSE